MRCRPRLWAILCAGLAATIMTSSNASPVDLSPLPLNQVLDPALEKVTDTATQQAETVSDTAAQLPALEPQALTLLSDPGTLPSPMAIVGADGKVAFQEITLPNGFRAVAREWLVMASADDLAALEKTPVKVIAEHKLSGLDMTLVRLRLETGDDNRATLASYLPENLRQQLDRNHVYHTEAESSVTVDKAPAKLPPLCRNPVPVGMVDTAVASDHPVFNGTNIHQRDFFSPDSTGQKDYQPPRDHGTAVASILSQPTRLPGLTLFNASVFYRRQTFAPGATSLHLVQGLNWLAEQGVRVINLSLAGPDNRLLRQALKQLYNQNVVIIAASGNQGPLSAPLYPAAYPFTVAVTATDKNKRRYRWASGGEHIQFAASGVAINVASGNGQFTQQSGTSMAAPVISGIMACELARQPFTPKQLVSRLAKLADDLGEPGRDKVFGFGWLADERYRGE